MESQVIAADRPDSDIIKPLAFYRKKRLGTVRVARQLTAAGAIGELSHDTGFTIFTNGAFSMIDAIRHILSRTGAANVSVTTWVPGVQELVDLADLKENADILSLRLIFDYGFRANKPKRAEVVTELFGAENIRETRNHAKIAIIRNSEWDYCMRGSLNLNGNFRCENLDGDNSPEMCDMFDSLWHKHAERFPYGFVQSGTEIANAYRELMAEGKPKSPNRAKKTFAVPAPPDPALERFNAIMGKK